MKFYAFVTVVILAAFVPRTSAAELSFEEGAIRRLSAAAKGDVSGAAVLVARDGQIVFQQGFGMADIARQIPITPETKFRIGSITKQFTASAVLRLEEQGKLSLSDSLSKYFPDLPRAEGVTLRQLLNHTSGLHSYTEKPEFRGRMTSEISPSELIAWFQNDPPDFAPGAGFRYNNSAYFLLGEIVAKVSGQPFGDFLRATFFEPLGMKDTGIYVNSAPPPNMALGYSWSEGKFKPAVDWDMSWGGGAGALYSTVGDLFRWSEALFNGRVLSERSFQAATTPVELPADVDGMNYGYGLMMFPVKRLPAVGHGGGLDGWSTDLIRVLDQRCTVVVLTNALPPPPALAPAQISRSLAEKLLAPEIAALPPLEEDPSVDPKTFPDYIGRFDYKGSIMTVTVEDNAIFSQITGQPKFRILPKGKDEFFWTVTDAQVRFLRDEKKTVIAARHTQGGNTFKAPKLSDSAGNLTPEQLDRFVGKYRYGPDTVMTVIRDGSQLLAQLTNQPRFPIFAKSETEFEWRVVAATVQFIKGDDGTIAKAVHTQNGRTFDAPVIK